MRASLITASLLFALVGCGSTTVQEQTASGTTGTPPVTTGTGGTGGGEDTGGSGGTGGVPEVAYPAPHPGMPEIPNHGGKVLHDPVIVTVTFQGDNLEQKFQQFGAEVGTLSWWSVVHDGYGVGPATSGGNVVIPELPPTAMTADEVEQWLADRINDGTLPKPTDQVIYALYFPASTQVSFSDAQGGGSSCQEFLGYHSSINITVDGANVPAAYAMINRCGGLDSTTETASHEFTEAATDPHPINGKLGYVITTNNPWTMLGGENADMCSGVSPVEENGWSLTRVWNNVTAKVGDQPCLPLPPDAGLLPYFNAAIVDEMLSAAPGETVTTEVDCYSFGPLPGAMTLQPQAFSKKLEFSFDKPTCTNGDKLTLTITVDAAAKKGSDYHYSLLAQLDDQTAHAWRGQVHVK